MKRRGTPARPSPTVLQNPLILFAKALARDLGLAGVDPVRAVAKILGDNAQAALVNHVAREFLAGQWRANLLQDWRAFQEKNSSLGLSKATTLYVRLLNRRGVKISQSSLYEYANRIDRYGIEGLLPEWHGGRPTRIPAVDLSLIRSLCRHTAPNYALFFMVRRLAKLPGQPITRGSFQKVVSKFMDHKRSKGRRQGSHTNDPTPGQDPMKDVDMISRRATRVHP